MPITISQGQNFSCQSFARLYVPDDIARGVQIAPNLWASRGLPVVACEHWERWMGEIAFRSIRSGLVLTMLAQQPARGHVVNLELTHKQDVLAIALILQGVPNYQEGFLLSGANETGEPEVRQFGRALVFYPTRGIKPLTVRRAELDRAAFLASKIEKIDWRRLRRAIDCLTKGSAEVHYNDEKIHQFARSLEGLILPDIATTRKQFIHRLQTLAVANPPTQEALGQMFDIRSKIQHLHSALEALPPGAHEEREELLYTRAPD